MAVPDVGVRVGAIEVEIGGFQNHQLPGREPQRTEMCYNHKASQALEKCSLGFSTNTC